MVFTGLLKFIVAEPDLRLSDAIGGAPADEKLFDWGMPPEPDAPS